MFCVFIVADYRKFDQSSFALNTSAATKQNLDQCAATVSTDATMSVPAQPAVVLTVTEELFFELFKSANSRAWTSIANDPIFLLPHSKYGRQINGNAILLSRVCDEILDCADVVAAFKHLFVNRVLLMQSDRDSLTRDVHCMRMNADLEAAFILFCNVHIHSTDETCYISKVMFQIWLRQITGEMLQAAYEQYKGADCVPELPERLSSTDQNVLYYMCGYMARKLKVACIKYKKLKKMENLINSLTTKEPVQRDNFVEQYRKWTEKQSRGGLLFAIPSFYLLIRELDTILRKTRMMNLIAAGSNKLRLQCAMFDGFMVKYHWNKLVENAHTNETDSLVVLDYLINLFITITGFAMARKERDRLNKKVEKGVPKSKSLRGKLKSRSLKK